MRMKVHKDRRVNDDKAEHDRVGASATIKDQAAKDKLASKNTGAIASDDDALEDDDESDE